MTRRSSQANIIDSSAKTGGYTVEVRKYEAGWWAFRFTPLGIVEMYAYRFRDKSTYTRLIFFHAGRRWERQFDRDGALLAGPILYWREAPSA